MAEKQNLRSLFGRRAAPQVSVERAEQELTRVKDEHKKSVARAEALRAKLEVAQAEAFASADAQREAKESRIRQGVKATVETVPMPVRLEVAQVKKLKILAAIDGTTASSIIRDCVRDHLAEKAKTDVAYANAIRMAMGPEAV